eukprot:2061584-Rhodomonas_salina.1
MVLCLTRVGPSVPLMANVTTHPSHPTIKWCGTSSAARREKTTGAVPQRYQPLALIGRFKCALRLDRVWPGETRAEAMRLCRFAG